MSEMPENRHFGHFTTKESPPNHDGYEKTHSRLARDRPEIIMDIFRPYFRQDRPIFCTATDDYCAELQIQLIPAISFGINSKHVWNFFSMRYSELRFIKPKSRDSRQRGQHMTSSACKPYLPAAARLARFLPPLPADGHIGSRGYVGREEPALAEIWDDPIFRRMMASDGVRDDHLLGIIADVRAKLTD